MTKQSKWVFFPYTTTDYKAAQVWLNGQAAAGWQVEKTLSYFNLVKLVCRDGPVARYCVDLCPASDFEPGYLELCREAGWTPVGRIEQMRLFRSQPGECPAPIQTDEILELERFEALYQRGVLWSGFFLFLLIVIPAILIVRTFQASPYKFAEFALANFRSMEGFIFALLLLPSLLLLACFAYSNLRYWQNARRAAAAKQPLPVSSQSQARRHGWLLILFTLFSRGIIILMLIVQLVSLSSHFSKSEWDAHHARTLPVVMAQDLGLPGENTVIVKSSVSPLARYHSLREFVTVTPSGQASYRFSLYSERYQAAVPQLTPWIAQQLRVSTGAENTVPDFRAVELGFEESWLWVWEPDEYSPLPHAILVLRQGSTAALLSGDVDWTDPTLRAVLWQRLELDPTLP